jgi:hypothetical protein
MNKLKKLLGADKQIKPTAPPAPPPPPKTIAPPVAIKPVVVHVDLEKAEPKLSNFSDGRNSNQGSAFQEPSIHNRALESQFLDMTSALCNKIKDQML